MSGTRPRHRGVTQCALTALALCAFLLAACSGGTGGDPLAEDLPETLVISSGGSSGIYATFGNHLGVALEERLGVDVEVRETGGAVENLQLVADGEAHLAFSTVDAVQDQDGDETQFKARALARIYDDFVHLVVTEESGIQTVDDLRGLTVSLGAPGSGTSLIAGRLLESAALSTTDLRAEHLGLNASIEALRTGEVDAFFWSGGLGTPGLVDLADEVPFRLVDLGAAAEEVRTRYGSGYRHGVVPKGSYGLPGNVQTMAVPNVLVVHQDLPDTVARAITEVLFTEQSRLAAEVPAASLLNRTRAIFTDPVELHPGALEYYRETKE